MTTLKFKQVRLARPTNQLERVVQFYAVGLGLEKIGCFKNHAGYDGIMLGLPGREYHLEFTQHTNGSPCPAPTKDNLLVFYLDDTNNLAETATRLGQLGYLPVSPDNSYWQDKGLTFEDPDGWRVVLFDGVWG